MQFITSLLALSTFTATVVRASPMAHTHDRRAGTVFTKCTVANTVAITFDDGPFDFEDDIVEILNKENVKATFFVNGNNYDCIYNEKRVESLRNAYDSGHQIASHTWRHKDLATLTPEEIGIEMDLNDTALKKILGVTPAMMRPPFGSHNADVDKAAGERGQDVIIWDFDSYDSKGVSAAESKGRYASQVAKHPSSILTLNHETYEATAHDVLPAAIATLKQAGYKFVTVADCLGRDAYQSVTKPAARDSSWTCT